MVISTRAYAKINWSLNIRGVLPNGYHDLDMLMQTISLSDELRFESAEGLSLTTDGTAGDENDLVLKAARALSECAAQRGMNPVGAKIALNKHIPARAGLGGASADCAETLKALNEMWNLNLSMDALLEIGARLGADVPFCLTGGFARVSGIGEQIQPLNGAPHCALVLITPGGGLSTPEVFREWDANPSRTPVQHDPERLANALLRGDYESAERCAFNALEAPAIRLMPEIHALMLNFRDAGARYVRMTGSGSTVYGVFDSLEAAKKTARLFPNAIAAETRG